MSTNLCRSVLVGREDLLKIDLEGLTVDGAGEDERSDHPAEGERSDEGRGFPVATRHGHAQAPAASAAAMGARDTGLGPGLVNEDKTVRFEARLLLESDAPPPQDVWAVLLGCVRCLYLRVIWWRWRKRWIVPKPKA